MNDWPITVETSAGWTYIGIPDRLGDGRPCRATFPTLEQLVGEDWSGAPLRQLLAEPRAWAWWRRTESYKCAGLSGERASDRIDPWALTAVAARRWLLQGTTLTFIPARDAGARDAVIEWAGADSEQILDAIWS